MTTPAQNINTTLTSVGQVQTSLIYSNGSQTNYPPYNVSTYSVNTRNVRPASGSSPKRPDGTRPPRGWDRYWGTSVAPVRSCVYFQDVGSNPYYRHNRRASLINLVGNGLDSILGSSGAAWSRLSSPGGFPSGVEAAARTKFRNELLDGKAEWGVTLGEMKETARGIRQFSEETLDVISWLAKSARRTKKEIVREILGIPPGTKRARPWIPKPDQKVINGWLEYQFSVQPLLGDIQTSSEALSDLLFEENRPLRMKIKTGAESRGLVDITSPGGVSPGWTGTVTVETRTQCHISAVYDVVPTSRRTLQQLGLGNPVATAWELTTLSWMVDYVWGVGDWLKSLTKIDGASFVEGSLTRVQRVTSSGPVRFNPTHSHVKLVDGFADYEYTLAAGRMQRIVLTDVAPGFHPEVRNRLGLTQMANSLAVLSKLLS